MAILNDHVDLRSAVVNSRITFYNGGYLRIYDGTKPAPGGAATNLLVEFNIPNPCASSSTDGVLTFNAIAQATASGTGTATWGRFYESDGTTWVSDADAGTGSETIVLDNTSVTSGGKVNVTSITFTAGNS